MVTITINGNQIQVEEGKNLLQCALDAGIYIPHLCYHPSLKSLGSCRMCVVHVEGQEDITTSCTLKAKEGLSIITESEKLKNLRMLALELLLAGHPECTSCPKYGNCELQMLIQYIGPKTGRMHTRTKGFKVEEDNPILVHDMNRCILCGRCVRACNELRGVKVLSYQQKDMETYVGTIHNRLLKDANCRFCGACAEVCPTGTIRDKIQFIDLDQSKEDAIVPCRYACPAHTDVPRYVRYAKEGKFDEAGAVIREKVPFPKVLGYICNHVCETECNREKINSPISIRDIKRFVAENDTGLYWKDKGKHLPETGKTVCVVGGGPAGMSAAYYLQKQGHQVTIKEAYPKLGGMLRYGIPQYRLPNDIVDEEIQMMIESGIHIETNQKVDQPSELLKDYDAVLFAIGAHQGVRLPIEGNNLDGVLLNTDFLSRVEGQEGISLGNRVVVLGGGNVAFDCARTVKRLGGEVVHVACLEKGNQMPADTEEIVQAQEEGIHIFDGVTFEKITGQKQVTGVDFMKVKSFTFDEGGRPIIEKEENSDFSINVDTVIFAVGQKPKLSEDISLDLDRHYIIVDQNQKTSEEGIFAAGDVVYGTHSVIKAIASGKDAARHIDVFLGGDGNIEEKFIPQEKKDPYIGQCTGFSELQRIEPEFVEAKLRMDNFNKVNKGYSREAIQCEANRCLQCDLRLDIEQAKTWADFSELKEVNKS